MATDRWYFVRESDGKIILHEENDGPAYLRKGAEAFETVVEFKDVPEHRRDQIKKELEAYAKKHQQVPIQKESDEDDGVGLAVAAAEVAVDLVEAFTSGSSDDSTSSSGSESGSDWSGGGGEFSGGGASDSW